MSRLTTWVGRIVRDFKTAPVAVRNAEIKPAPVHRSPRWQVEPLRHIEATVGVCPDERCGMFDRPQGTEDGRCETCNTTLGPRQEQPS